MKIYKIEEGGETDFVEADSLADALLRWRDHCVRTRDAVADIEPDSVRCLGYGESLLAREREAKPQNGKPGSGYVPLKKGYSPQDTDEVAQPPQGGSGVVRPPSAELKPLDDAEVERLCEIYRVAANALPWTAGVIAVARAAGRYKAPIDEGGRPD
jgi:hypothetical protein